MKRTPKNLKPDWLNVLDEALACQEHLATLAELLQQSGGNPCLPGRLVSQTGGLFLVETARLQAALARLSDPAAK